MYQYSQFGGGFGWGSSSGYFTGYTYGGNAYSSWGWSNGF